MSQIDNQNIQTKKKNTITQQSYYRAAYIILDSIHCHRSGAKVYKY